MHDTSAATAQSATLGAMLMRQYPALWPESARASIVHSARWNRRMLAGLDPHARVPKERVRELLRVYGWGEPDLARAMKSANNRATILSQNTLQPFQRIETPDSKGKVQKRINQLESPRPKQRRQGHKAAGKACRVRRWRQRCAGHTHRERVCGALAHRDRNHSTDHRHSAAR